MRLPWAGQEPAATPYLSEAYLCCPNPRLMQRDLEDALIRKRLPSRLHSHLTVLPQVAESPEVPTSDTVSG